MTVAFLGLTGPSGILPRHYTELLLRLDREGKGPEKNALRDWLDLFNHRLISLFHRAWEKYRFYIPYARGEYSRTDLDAFTRALYSLIGLGFQSQQNRLRVSVWEQRAEEPEERVLGGVDDLSLLFYSGFLAHRPRSAVALEALLQDYFQLKVTIQQFQGQWLHLDPSNQSTLSPGNNLLGVNVVAGERVWDVQGKFRIRLGPMRYATFSEFLPDRAVTTQRKAFYLLAHLVRYYVGAEFSFDVQLVLKAEDVPPCQLADGPGGGPRLGWNTWIISKTLDHDADDALFEGEELRWINGDRPVLDVAVEVT
jgi:type VI secretion system protein ImpH